MYLETIQQTLFPRFEHISRGKTPEKIESLRKSFDSHSLVLAKYCEQNDWENLQIDFFVELHKLLYPAWFEIKARWNDGKNHIMFPWEFRKQYLAKYIHDFSDIKNIKKDFQKLLDHFNEKKEKTREDILRWCLDFWKVHPFWDSNGTISILVCDILCVKYWYKPINILKIRFKNKSYWFQLLEKLEKEKYSSESLGEILELIDNF